MGCGAKRTNSNTADGTGSDKKEAAVNAAANAYAAAEVWVADQTCPISPDDNDCTTMHAKLTVGKPAEAKWSSDPAPDGTWKSTCTWSATVDCDKEIKKPKEKTNVKVLTPLQLVTVTARSIDLDCEEEFDYDGTALGAATKPTCGAALIE